MPTASRGRVPQKPAAIQQPSRTGTLLFCTPRQWGVAIMSGLILSALACPWYGNISWWIGVVLFLMVITVVHMVFTYGLVVCLPHIAILVSGLQYVLAAWLSFYYPSSNPLFNIGQRLPDYLSYAGWVMTVVCLAWALSLLGLRKCAILPAPG